MIEIITRNSLNDDLVTQELFEIFPEVNFPNPLTQKRFNLIGRKIE